MKKIRSIAHISDIHIRKSPSRNEEYQIVFNNLLKSLKKEKPDRIVLVGDLVNDYLHLEGEQLILANKFLYDLADIAPVRITRGNHDMRKKNAKRVDSVKAIVKTLNNPNVIYYDKTDVFYDDNVAWFVWHHGDSKTSPWKTKEGKIYEKLRINGDYVAIDLFHDPINGCVSDNGVELKSKIYHKLSDFKGDYGFFGDIHKMQYLDKDKTKAYSGSLIAQKFTEGDDDFHGYLLWDIETGSVDEIEIHNDYSYKNVVINPYTDFDDLDFEIDNPTKHMRVRFVWATLPQTRNKENERRLSEYLRGLYENVTISHTNKFIEDGSIVVNDKISLNNINDVTVQHEIFKEFLNKIGVEDSVIDDVIKLDGEIIKSIDVDVDSGIEWDIVKFGGNNFMSYEKLDIDWRKLEGLFQITGINTAGKTTILKLISYLLFGKTLETESRKKFGDSRYVNNRNGAKTTDTYCIIEANGEYFGIKRNTVLEYDKNKQIKGAPTTLDYYVLSDPDEEMGSDNLVENLNEDQRKETQKKINGIIGSYDNFKRIVLTTSDTLNEILKNEMADFIDSLLFDSGLDIFDKKLEAVKNHAKKINNKGRINCNVESTNTEITNLKASIGALQQEIYDIEKIKIPDVRDKIKRGKEFVNEHIKKLYKIDTEIATLNVVEAKSDIESHEEQINKLEARKTALENEIDLLQETYDEKRLDELLEKKETHRQTENKLKFEIKTVENKISVEEHKIEIINGDIFRLKQEGAKLKKEAIDLKNSKTCPTCGQIMTKEHISHITKLIDTKKTEMFGVANKMEVKESEKLSPQSQIKSYESEIKHIKTKISTLTTEMEEILIEIGTLTNQKNDVEKRQQLQNELNNIPSKIENEELKISILKSKILSRENSFKQIEENKINQQKINNGNARIEILEAEKDDLTEDVYIKKTSIAEKQLKIKNNEILIAEFKQQEYQDTVINLYKKCVHRDGIPKQMLSNYIVPKINQTLESILSSTQFNVWLDPIDFRPKLVYNNRPTAVIDCIGASGKERTFAAIVLKFALNQVNVKSKPMFFFLDEVMGKLTEDSIEEFIEILQIIKNNMKRVLIIEHNHEVNPNYLINVSVDDDGISSLELE
ncbi:MAG: metallophosphoesterase [bacterium]